MTTAVINYAARTHFRQRYYANDHNRDTVVIDGHPMEITDGRTASTDLDAAGFKLVPHVSKVSDFQDRAEVAAVHGQEIVDLLLAHPKLAAMDDANLDSLTSAIKSDDLRTRWMDGRQGNFPDEQVADSRSKVLALAEMTDTALADGRDWLMGDFSIADLVTYPWLCSDLVPEAFAGKLALQGWMARMAARPGMTAALKRATVSNPEECWAPGPEINRWG
jgi:hypothetical protein